MKKIDDDTSVTVTQDLNDGSIIVDVDDPIRNVMGESGQDTSVQMMLKKGQADETTKGTPADEFSFTENDMRNYMDCLLYTSPSPRDGLLSRMPSSA